MAHITLNLSAATVAPFAANRRVFPSGRGWRLRLVRATAAAEAGLPVRHGRAAAAARRIAADLRLGDDGDPGRRASLRSRAVPVLVAAALLAGCAGITPVPTTVAAAGMPNPEEALRQSMQHVDAEMAELGTLRAQPASARTSAGPVVPDDLQRIVDFTWKGSLDKGVAQLAQSIGYTFYTTAPVDAPPVDVVVQVHGAPAFDAFKALGEEAGARATVQVDPLHHQVQVIHHA